MGEAAEVIYAIRRADGDLLGEFSFLVVPEGDWSPATEDSEYADEPVEYEMVRMTVEVVETRSFPTCRDGDCGDPPTHWGLCEKHAREDDPDAFKDEEKADV